MDNKRGKNQRFFHHCFFPKSQKGTHVGVVLSFAIFIVFLVFLYSIIEPAIKTQKDKQFFLDYLERELIKQVSADMTTATLSISATATKNCIEIENFTAEIGMDYKLIVKNEFENVSLSYISSSDPNNLLIDRSDSANKFFKIYFSEQFDQISETTINPCTNLKKEDGGYALGLTRTNKYISTPKIIELKNKYENEYETLKEGLEISIGNEFGFSFTYSNGTKIKTKEKKVLTSIYAKEIPIQYIDDKANIIPGFINIRVW